MSDRLSHLKSNLGKVKTSGADAEFADRGGRKPKAAHGKPDHLKMLKNFAKVQVKSGGAKKTAERAIKHGESKGY